MKSSKEKLTSAPFLEAIRKGSIAPLYFLYGEEDYFIDEIVDAIIRYGVDNNTRGFNLDILNGADVGAKKILSVALSFPMMAERRVVVVHDIERIEDLELLENYFEHPSPTTVLVLCGGKFDTRRVPFPMLKKQAVGGKFSTLREKQIPIWLQQKVKDLKKTMTPNAVDLLISYVGTSLRELASELEKLVLAVGGKQTIDEKSVQQTVGISREYSVFDFLDAVGNRNRSKAIVLLNRMMDSGESPQKIIVMMTRHFMQLWRLHDARRQDLKETELASAAGIVPFKVGDFLLQLKFFTMPVIERALLALAETDEELKSKGTDPKLAMDVLLNAIMKGLHSPSPDQQPSASA